MAIEQRARRFTKTDPLRGGKEEVSSRIELLRKSMELLVRADCLSAVDRELHQKMWQSVFGEGPDSVENNMNTSIADARRDPKLAWQRPGDTPKASSPQKLRVKTESRSPKPDAGQAANQASEVKPEEPAKPEKVSVSLGQIRRDWSDQIGAAHDVANAFSACNWSANSTW